MALVTANQFQLQPNTMQAVQQGLQLGGQIKQQFITNPKIEELTKLAAGGDTQALSQLSTIDPQKAQQIQGFQAQKMESRFNSVVDAALELQSIPTMEGRVAAARQRKAQLINDGLPTQDTDQFLDFAEAGDFDAANALIDRAVNAGVQRGRFKAPEAKKQQAGFTLSAGQKRFDAQGNEVASVNPERISQGVGAAPIPPVLLEGLSNDLAQKGAAAYSAAGGGKDGLSSFQKVIDKGSEQERRLTSPKLLKNSFPKASEAEFTQLQAAMDSAKTTEAGLQAAGKIRDEQRRLVKVQGFQDRSITLLDKILSNDELGDVLGSVEGNIDLRMQDSEAELISDIQEVGDILTADNLKLMSGVLSESDIAILRNLAGGGLKRTRTEERFRKDVQAIRDEMAAKRVLTVDEKSVDTSIVQAPPAAIQMLQQNPQLADQFQAKFGYLPEGI